MFKILHPKLSLPLLYELSVNPILNKCQLTFVFINNAMIINKLITQWSKKFVLLLGVWLFVGSLAYAQSNKITVSGKIIDETGQSVPNATVMVKGTAVGTSADLDGNYTITVNPDATLVFSFIGFNNVEEAVNGRAKLDVTMISGQELEAVVMVGYGSQKAKDLTAPIALVNADVFEKQATANPAQALQGKVAGVQVINNGAPGSGPAIRIRGVGSIGDYAKPLYVVDGVFVDNIDFLGNGDIESMSILKDASASAIYGVRAANGVILITTRSGKRGDARVTYDGYVGIQMPVNLMQMTNTEQYVTLMNEANVNTIGYVPKKVSDFKGANTNWYKEMLHNAIMTSHSVDVSGATDKVNYSVGLNYLYQDGILNMGNDYSRFNIRGRGEYQVSKYVKVGASFLVSRYVHDKPNDGAFFQAFLNPPTYNVYDESNEAAYPVKFGSPQSVGLGNSYGNPYASAYYYDVREDGYHILPTAFLEIKFLDNRLTFKSQYNQDLTFFNSRDYALEYFVGGSQGRTTSKVTKKNNTQTKMLFDNTLVFADAIGKHNYSLMAGMSVREEGIYWVEGSALNVPGTDDSEKYIKNGSASGRDANDSGDKNRGMSYFFRGTYNFDSRYLATFTFRADGSSKFQDKWGYFPSVGLGWVITAEDFMSSQKVVDYLKLRTSWGMLGNDNVPANSSYIVGKPGRSSSGIFNDVLVDGVGAQTVYQNYLKWEVVNEFDVGVDYAFLKHRLTGAVDFFHRTTNNVVFNAPIASGGGVGELLGNNGTVRNMGVEFSIEWKDQIGTDFSYTIGGNLTYLNNRVTEVQNRPDGRVPGKVINGATATYAVEGKPIGSFYGYEVAGIYQTKSELKDAPAGSELGDFKFRDVNGDGTIDAKDVVYLGSPVPTLMGGIDLGLNYKNWDFSISLQGQLGNKILNQKRMSRGVFAEGNYDVDFYNNRWTKESPSTSYPSAAGMNKTLAQQPNSFFVEDGSYIRIQSVQIGYTIPRSASSVWPDIRVYASAQRPLTVFGYNGFTTEVSGAPNETGIDNNVYPMQAIYSIGARIKF